MNSKTAASDASRNVDGRPRWRRGGVTVVVVLLLIVGLWCFTL